MTVFKPNCIDPRPHELLNDETYKPSAPLKGPLGSDWGIGGVGADASNTTDKIPGRFMRGLLNDEKNARARWQQTKLWREKEGIDFLLDEPNPGFYQFKKHYKHYYHKQSKTGEYLYVERCGQGKVENLWKLGFNLQQLARHYVWTSEYMWRIRDRDDDKMIISLFDLKGCTLNQLKGSQLTLFKECSMLIGNHYPERSKMTFVINAPWWISAAFTIIKPFMDPRTFEKIKVLGSDYKKHLFEYFDPSVIPRELGGTDDDALGEAPIEYEIYKHIKKVNSRWTNMPLSEDDPVERDGYTSLLHPFDIPKSWLNARDNESTPNLRDKEEHEQHTVASSCEVLDSKAVDNDVISHLNKHSDIDDRTTCNQVGAHQIDENKIDTVPTVETRDRVLSTLNVVKAKDVVNAEVNTSSGDKTTENQTSGRRSRSDSSQKKGQNKRTTELDDLGLLMRPSRPISSATTTTTATTIDNNEHTIINRTEFTTANMEPKPKHR